MKFLGDWAITNYSAHSTRTRALAAYYCASPNADSSWADSGAGHYPVSRPACSRKLPWTSWKLPQLLLHSVPPYSRSNGMCTSWCCSGSWPLSCSDCTWTCSGRRRASILRHWTASSPSRSLSICSATRSARLSHYGCCPRISASCGRPTDHGRQSCRHCCTSLEFLESDPV